MRTGAGFGIASAMGIALLALPAQAQEVVIEIHNLSTLVVESVDAFPVDDDGAIADDTIGGHHEPIVQEETAFIPLSGDCGPVFLLIGIQGGGEAHVAFDTCESVHVDLVD